MNKNYTSIEQSKKLLELGLNPESADMYYGYHKEKPELLPYQDTEVKLLCIPCWSVGTLLKLIPGVVLGSIYDGCNKKQWYCNTIQFGETYFDYDGNYHYNPIDACIEAIEWIIGEGHKKELEYDTRR